MVGRSATRGLPTSCVRPCPSCGRARITSPRSISARSSMFALAGTGGGGGEAGSQSSGQQWRRALELRRFSARAFSTRPAAAVACWRGPRPVTSSPTPRWPPGWPPRSDPRAGTILAGASAVAAGGGAPVAAAAVLWSRGGRRRAGVWSRGGRRRVWLGGAWWREESGWNSLVSITRPCACRLARRAQRRPVLDEAGHVDLTRARSARSSGLESPARGLSPKSAVRVSKSRFALSASICRCW